MKTPSAKYSEAQNACKVVVKIYQLIKRYLQQLKNEVKAGIQELQESLQDENC